MAPVGSVSAGITAGVAGTGAGYDVGLTEEQGRQAIANAEELMLTPAERELILKEGQVAALSRAKGYQGPNTGAGGTIGDNLFDWLARISKPAVAPVGLSSALTNFVPFVTRTGSTF